jgi:phosphoenolpyruvate carboxykinase (ATP)
MPATDNGPLGLTGPVIHNDPTTAILYEHALRDDPASALADSGALVAFSGEKTGRSPADKRIVRDAQSESDIWWGPVNRGLTADAFAALRRQAVDHLDAARRVYVVDGWAGADIDSRVAVRVVCERPYHALFMRNMLITPGSADQSSFDRPDVTIINAGRCPADTDIDGVDSHTSIALSFERSELVILGTEYAGEMKKGVFTLMNHLMPARDILSMHCSANAGADGQVSLFFGLSGTGKTTLSADPRRALIGDDEHCWSDQGIANIEGGCYAKVIDLSAEAEPQISTAIRFGAVLENVVRDPDTGAVDYSDGRITQNTRCAYPIEHVDNARLPGVGGHPRDIILLTCDAFSVLPPVSRLTAEQAMYHFISGYTAKVAGTEMGVTEPQATFSACFGAPFLVRHPAVYARMLAERIEQAGSRVWMINTGWIGGPYGIGRRIPLAYTRAMIDAIHDDALTSVGFWTDPAFGLAVPERCPGVPDAVINPMSGWPSHRGYLEAAAELAALFHQNFAAYADVADAAVLAAGPATAERIRRCVAEPQAVTAAE